MIEPTEADLGRKVVYRSFREADPEEGEISSFAKVGGEIDPRFVFVKYPRNPSAMLTPCRKLEWLSA